ncbi:MAG: amidohydrolase [Marinilabiliales bacterium]|nr:MAG: amidohydrolase [Marinilabiliales bacterium]
MKNRIQSAVNDVFDKMIEIRRHIHMFPELSGQEEKTSEYIAAILKDWGVGFTQNIAGYGIVAQIEGVNADAACGALRADTDALPIQEMNDVPYKSKIPGVMHACGHDAHTAALLGTIYVLNSVKDSFNGRLKFFFQPSEEKFPGGAKLMIEEGVLENPDVQFVLGAHVLPTLEAGKVGVKSGMYMASTDEIYLTVKGKGGHAATPELLVDPVLIAVEVLSSLQQVISRKNNPAIPSVLSFGRFLADGRTNIIPDEVKLEGTIRTFSEEWRKDAHAHIERIATGIATSMGGECKVNIAHGYPFLVNNEELTEVFRNTGKEFLGKDFVDLPLRMTAEDFAYYSQKVPSVFYRFGVSNPEKGITSNLHSQTFDIDEEALKTAASIMSMAAIQFLDHFSENK